MGTAYTLGIADTGVLIHDPILHGNLRVIGQLAEPHAKKMLAHWADEMDVVLLSALPSRMGLWMEQHDVAEGLPPVAWMLRGLKEELDERLDTGERESPILVVFDGFDQLIEPVNQPRAHQGSEREILRNCALYIRDLAIYIAHNGPAVGISILATTKRPTTDPWSSCSTIHVGLHGQTITRPGEPTGISFAWA